MKNKQTTMWARALKNGGARNYASSSRVYVVEPQREKQKMPLLFYFPLIIWMGMLEAMQDELRVPVKARR
jgi:hypothetical protein